MTRLRLPIFALLAANALSYTAEALAMVAIPWFVLELTGSYSRLGIVGFFTVMPRVVATFLGGPVVDRIGFRSSSVVSDLLSGLSVCCIPVLYATDNLSFAMLLVLVVVGAFCDGPGATAKSAMVPELAGIAGIELDRVNAYFQSARRFSQFVGPVAAGLLIGLTGVANVLWVNGVVFAMSAMLVAIFIPHLFVENRRELDAGSFWCNTLYGFRFIRQHRLLIWLAGIVSVMNLLDGPIFTVQMPALVNEEYGGARQLGIMLGAEGAGAVFGTLIFSVVASRLARRTTFVVAFCGVGLAFLALSTAPPFPGAIAIMVAVGLAGSPVNPVLMSIWQERVPVASRARVFGTTTAIALVAMPIGQLLGGYLIEWIGVQPFIATLAVIYLAAVATMVVNPVLREMDRPVHRHSHADSTMGASAV